MATNFMEKRLYLCTTAISEIWEMDYDLLILGPWCLTPLRNRDLVINKGYTLLPTPFKPTIKIKEAVDYCQHIYEKVLPELSKEMNRLHSVDFPEKYWRVLIGPWLLHFIGVLYDRYKRIELAYEKYPGLHTSILPIDKCMLLCRDTIDFVKFAGEDDDFNLKIFSLVFQYLYPDNYEEVGLKGKNNRPLINIKWNKGILNYLRKLVFSKRTSDIIILGDMYHISWHDAIEMRLDERFKYVGFESFEEPNEEVNNYFNKDIRERIKIALTLDEFSLLLTKILPSAIPLCYIENYRVFKRQAELVWRPENKIFGSAVGWYFNESLKYYAAEAILYGTKLLDFQHGGGYGSTLAVPPENLSLEKDILYTWGWHSIKGGCTVPLPSPHLSRLKDTHNINRKARVLFIGTAMPRYHYRFDTGLKTDDIQDYFTDKTRFINTLFNRIKLRLTYRPYYEYGWKEIDYIKNTCPTIQISARGNLVDLMKKARLVVIDHPQTSFLEAFCINVPTILYWDHDIYLMRSEAEPYFQILRDAGILFTDPEDASNKVNQVFDDPIKWWRTEAIQKARLTFCERFALSSEDWKRDWAEAFKKLLKSTNN